MASQPQLPEQARVLGLPVSAVDLPTVLRLAQRAVSDGPPLRIAVTNHNKCWLAVHNPALREYLEVADVVVPETSVVWAARVLRRSGVEPVWGVSLMAELLNLADERQWSVFFLGARRDVVTDLVERVRRSHVGIRVVGWSDGYLDDEGEQRVRADIAHRRPDVLFVAMGSPRQELFLAGSDGASVSVGVGGSFDVHAGRKRDAPKWVRGSGVEWLYRAALSPRLLKRYAVVLPWFVLSVLRERVTGQVP